MCIPLSQFRVVCSMIYTFGAISSDADIDMVITTNLGGCLARNTELISWVEHMANLCEPEHVFWCDGSAEENQFLCDLMVQSGTLIKLNEKKRPNSYLAPPHPSE